MRLAPSFVKENDDDYDEGVDDAADAVAHIPSFNLLDFDPRELKQACTETGFFAVSGHGIDMHLVELVFSMSSKHIFDLDMSTKNELVVGDMQRSRGWEMSPEHITYMEENKRKKKYMDEEEKKEPSAVLGIVNERFCIGPAVCPDKYIGTKDQPLFYPNNVFPQISKIGDDDKSKNNISSLQDSLQELYCQMTEASILVMEALALCLDQPKNTFYDPPPLVGEQRGGGGGDKTTTSSLSSSAPAASLSIYHQCSNMQVANYPSLLWDDDDDDDGEVISDCKEKYDEDDGSGFSGVFNKQGQRQQQRPRQRPTRVKSHADSGTVTLLIRRRQVLTDESKASGGLEILTKEGKWLRVPKLREGEVLVNIGNLLKKWTNGVFQSTKHRVTNPPAPAPNSRRMSIAYFQKPDPDMPISPLNVDGATPRDRNLAEKTTATNATTSVLARSLTRVGILHRLINEKGLTNEEARHEYHRIMESPYLNEKYEDTKQRMN
mmetsp:Transcript_41754/g.67190  ORF Transcript_41754/g.67190 Transcript_41754/m.67190 type:complete len:492 (+) Transcript_41754:633-2108(+)